MSAVVNRRFWLDRCVIITGASSGIGAALAQHVASRGARVGLLARNEQRLREVAEQLQRNGATAAIARADVTDRDAVADAVRSLEQALGRADVCIANAGTHRYTPGHRLSAADVAAVFAVNVQGAANVFDAVLPGMIHRRSGALAAVASIAGMLGLPEVGAYSASKSALITLMQSLRVDLHTQNVSVTTVCPGFVDTPFIAGHDKRVLRFVMTAEAAAAKAARAIERRRAEVYFPWQTTLIARAARWMPPWLYARVAANAPQVRAPREALESARFSTKQSAP